MPNVLVVAETRAGELRRVALEVVSAARTMADALGGDVHAIVAGPPGISSASQQLGRYGADLVLAMEHPRLVHYDPESLSATVAERARSTGARLVLIAASAQGKDLAPRVAARLDVPIAADLISLEIAGETIVGKHPVNTGKVIATLALTAVPAVVSLRPGMFSAAEAPRAGRVEPLAPTADPDASRVVVTEMRQSGRGKLDLSEAPVIVSGGRGLKAPENFRLVEELAAAFGNAAVGCTRAVSDEGWRPHSDQIGQTGRTVAPELYIAVAISGAIQHIAGIRNAKTIVAINRDKEAPIFKVADYGIVGDAFEVVPALTDAVREARRAQE
jgi:electron transfer flavoprotein alpha subunit